MSNDKPVAIATIKFYANKHIEVGLDTIAGVNPRMLSVAGNLLNKKYRSMRNKHNANAHAEARAAKAKADADAIKDEAAFHKAEDERLQAEKEAPEDPGGIEVVGPTPDTSEEEETVEELAAKLLADAE